MLWRRRRRDVVAVVAHPPRDLVVRPAEARGAVAEAGAGGDRGAGQGLHAERRLHLVADGVHGVVGEVVDQVAVAPAGEHLRRRAPVEPGVDLGAAADATPFGVGDRRAPEGGRDAGVAVLAPHLLQREGHHLALADVLALLHHEHVEPGLGEQRRRGGAAGAGADHEHVARQRRAGARPPSSLTRAGTARRRQRCRARSPTHRRS